MNYPTSTQTANLLILYILFIPLGFAAVPVNDNLTDAIEIAKLPYSHEQSTLNASDESAEVAPECASETSASVWYKYTPTNNQVVVFETFGSDYDTVLSVWHGKTHPLKAFECNDDKDVEQSQVSASFQAGITYYIKVSGYKGKSGQLTLNARTVNPLLNDNLAEAIEITGPLYSNTQNTQEATHQIKEESASCSQSSASVWYQYTPSTSQKVIFDTIGSNYNTVLSVWTGKNHPLTEMACNDDSDNESSLQSQLSVAFTAGTTYYINVAGVTNSEGVGETGILVFNATFLPPNDDLANAIQIETKLPYSHTQNTDKATVESKEAISSCGVPDSSSVWYQYTPDTDQNVSISTVGSDYDTVLSIWTGDAHPLTQVDCNDDAITNLEEEQASQISLLLKASKNYFFKISGLSQKTGNLIFHVKKVVSDIAIAEQPTDQTIDYGQTATLTVEVNGTEPFSYQWYQGDSGDVSQPRVNIKTFTTQPLTQSTRYWVRISNPTGNIDSKTVTITVNKPNGIGINTDSSSALSTTAHFVGHITTSLEGGKNVNQVSQTDMVYISFTIIVDPKHVGKKADIVMVVFYKTDISEQVYMRRWDEWSFWNNIWKNLAVAETDIQLSKNLDVIVFEGNVKNMPGNFTVYVGYKLRNGDIFYSAEPITFAVK